MPKENHFTIDRGIPEGELKNHIEKMKDGKYRLLSHDGKNLGTFDTYAEAAKHEGEVEFFKKNQVEVRESLPQLVKRQRTNATSANPEIYYARHMEPGLCGYEDEMILVDADGMKNMAKSFAGKPVYVYHQDVDLTKLQEEADGYVADCFYNELDGWLWSKIIIVSDEAKEAVRAGWSVSNAYVPTAEEPGGSHHNVDFHKKIVNADFTHLAIVPDPRYENAKIFSQEDYKAYCGEKKKEIEELRNSKEKKPMLKFWKNKKEEVKASDIDDETMVELRNGKSISVKEMNAAIAAAESEDSELAKTVKKFEALQEKKNAKKEEKKNEKDEKEKENDADGVGAPGADGHKEERMIEEDGEEKFNAEPDDSVMHKGKEYKASDFSQKYMALHPMKNEKDEEDKKNEKEEGEKDFKELKNARHNAKAHYIAVDLDVDQLARGSERYGSTK